MNKRAFIPIFFVFSSVILTGCSLKPTYYSQDYVKTYAKDVFGKDTQFIEQKVSTKGNEGNPEYEYVFREKRGISFSIISSTEHPNLDGPITSLYCKRISDNYLEAVISYYHQDIMSILKKSDFEADFSNNKYLNFYLTDYKQINDAAKLISDIDDMVALNSDYKKYNKSGSTLTVNVYLRPKDYEKNVNWRLDQTFSFAYVKLTTKTPRLKSEEVNTSLERMLANAAKGDCAGYYLLQEDLLNKYPAPIIALTSINETSLLTREYKFQYDEKTDEYWIYNLDPCQDFDDFPYNYTDKYKFSDLVKGLGGTYDSKNWTAKWQIGSDVFTAKLYNNKENNYIDFAVKKNGNRITLSKPEDKRNGTISGRAFTIEDLENMLGVTIKVDQKSMTATMSNR